MSFTGSQARTQTLNLLADGSVTAFRLVDGNEGAGKVATSDASGNATWQTVSGALGYTPENVANKATDFNVVNNTLYPTVQAAKTYMDSLVVGLLDDRGNYDASSNLWPSTGGSGTAGAILKGDLWYISVAGTLGGTPVLVGYSIRALVDTPGQTSTNWDILQVGLGYVPENVANKATDFGTLNNNLYPTTQAVASGTVALTNKTYEGLTITPTTATLTIPTGRSLNLSDSFITSGAFSLTLTVTSATNVTLPDSGTLYGTKAGSITSAQLLTSMSDKTGTGVVVFNTAPVFSTSIGLTGLTNTTLEITSTATGTTGVGSIYGINTTNGAYAQIIAFGSASAGTTFGINRTGMAALILNPATGGVGAIGTASNFPLVFCTNNTEKVRVLTTGDVGIGTATPDVYAVGSAVKYLTVQNTSGTNTSSFLNLVANGTGAVAMEMGNALIKRAAIYAIDGSNLLFYTNNTNSGTALTERMRISSTGLFTYWDGGSAAYGTVTGWKHGSASNQKQGWWGATPVVQQVLATGAGRTADDIISMLQTYGLCRQS